MNNPSSRLTKFRLALEEYNFSLCYKKGTEHVIADTLSRLPLSDLKTMITQEEILITTRSKTVSSDTCQNNNNSAVKPIILSCSFVTMQKIVLFQKITLFCQKLTLSFTYGV